MLLKVFIIIITILIVLIINYKFTEKKIILSARKLDNCKELNIFYDKFKKIYKKYKIEYLFNIESSTKISSDSFNFNKYYIFIDFNYLNNNELLNDILNLKESNKLIRSIKKSIKNRKGQFIYGEDLLNKSKRVYLNYNENNKFFINAYEWSKNSFAIKNYDSVEKKDWKKLITILKNSFGERLIKKVLNTIPIKNWDYVYSKKDSRNKNNEICYYFSFKYEPMLKEIYGNLLNLLEEIYFGEKDIINRWYESYKNCLVSWITLSKNNCIKLSIYFCSYGRGIDFLTNLKYKNI